MFVLWVLGLVIFLGIDFLWLGWLGRGLYVDEIGDLLRPRPDMAAAAAFYLLYSIGLLIFVLKPAQMAGSLQHALVYGALFGLVAYGTYDLTNLAVLKGFTLKIAIIDMVWGAVLTAVTSALTILIARQFSG